MSKTKRFIINLISTLTFCGIFVLTDRFIKSWAYHNLNDNHNGAMDIIKGVIGFRYTENIGAAWSILSNAPWVFISVSVVICIGIIVFILSGKCDNLLMRFSLLFILSGGAGNLIDRLFSTGSLMGNRNGFVIDMFEFEFIDFPIFNFADICVCIGAGLLILYILIFEFKDTSKNKAKAEENE